MTSHIHAEAQRLFHELIELDSDARDARLGELAPEAEVTHEVWSLLAAAARAGDFLGLLDGANSRGSSPVPISGMVTGRYRLERQLGSGAMGDVHLAWDVQLERPVALKFLRMAAPATDVAIMARFRTEARAAARLEHRHVATVYDSGATADGRLFIVMAFYPGDTLRQRLEGGPLPADDALRIAAEIADALAVAHAAGVVHRDVKPANVLFDAEGGVRLTDFGIAKLLTDPEATARGTCVGTPAYMSPEQARGEAVDGGTDLWALGVMLHEMLTGRRPHIGADPEARASRRDALAPAVRALIASLLTEDRAQRPSRATAVRDALVAARAGTGRPRDKRARPGSLPGMVTSLIGRQRELAAAELLLDDTRLLTLVGPGGTGKTRLALALASGARDRFADGVWFVPLADIANAELVPSAIAQALGLRDLGTTRPDDRVVATLGRQQLLLVLDNFEHVLAAASFVPAMLAACPNLTVLATSRALLGVPGEQTYPVPPLGTPRRAAADAADSESVQLFVSRARAVRPSFTLDAESLGAVAEICRRLDGLPLALELAAARSMLLSPRAILARLEQRFDLLRAAADGRPARHSTMRAVMDWSFILLTDEERALFCRLAVFAGGASLEAAEAVARDLADAAGASSPVLDLVTSLASKSLIQVEEQPDGEPRLLMLETVRQFGLDRLAASADEGAARRAHRACCVSLAERGASLLRGPDQALWLDRLEREYPNFRVALDGALADGMKGLGEAARLAVALHRHWLTRGPLFEGIDRLRRIRTAADAPDAPALPAALRAQLLSSAAHLAGARSLFREARELFAGALVRYRDAGDRAGIAATLNNLAWQVWNVGDLGAGEAMSLEAMEIHTQLGDELGVALSRNNLAWIAMERGEFDASAQHFDAVIASHQRRGDVRSVAFATSWLGVLAARQGDLARAAALQERALEAGIPVADTGFRTLALVRLAAVRHASADVPDQAALLVASYVPTLREFGRLWPLAHALTELGVMLLDDGEPARARVALEEALAARRESGSAVGVAETLLLLGVAEHRSGNARRAATLLGDALVAAESYGAPPLSIACLEAVAPLALDAGQPERATRLLGAATQACERLGTRRSPRREMAFTQLRRALLDAAGAERFARAWTDGIAMPLDEAARDALVVMHAMTDR